jgi:hypothetical protein
MDEFINRRLDGTKVVTIPKEYHEEVVGVLRGENFKLRNIIANENRKLEDKVFKDQHAISRIRELEEMMRSYRENAKKMSENSQAVFNENLKMRDAIVRFCQKEDRSGLDECYSKFKIV